MVVFDTYAWIEYFRGSEKGLTVKRLLSNGGITPSIVLAEISRKYIREGIPFEETKRRLLFIQGKTIIKCIDIDVSLLSSKIYLQLKKHAKDHDLRTPSLADSLVYSMAIIEKDKLVTGDRLFKGLPHVIYIGN
ncbi:MAG: PIN domain-containing protein [Desulfurococcales archaeon]|nr:PIN domain-containing protein [Desulfurococcales archaeon]